MDISRLSTMPDLDRETVISLRRTYMSPTLQGFCMTPDNPVVISRGEGPYLYDTDGKKYLDCTGQNMCISIGVGHPVTKELIRQQLDRVQHITTLLFNEMSAQYAKELVDHLPAGQDWVVQFVNSGAEALDLAFMMSRAYSGNFDLLYLRDAYHGLHGVTMGSCGFAVCRQPAPSAPGFHSVICPNQYRPLLGKGTDQYVEEIRETIWQNTCGRIAGMVIEPIQGMGGVVPMPEGYMKKAAEVVHAAGGLLISDEVQTGFARTGSHYWGFQAQDVIPDIIAMGKGIGNGLPIAGVAVRREIAEAFAGAGLFFNTLACNPLACASALSVLRVIDAEDLQSNAAAMGAYWVGEMKKLQQRFPVLGDIRGDGLILGFEFVTDPETKEPATELCHHILQSLREDGILIACVTKRRNIFRINPSLTVGKDDMDHIVFAFENALKKFC